MSLTTPYYFSGSANMSMSVWMRSNDFQSEVSLSLLSASVQVLLTTSTGSAWQYDSSYPCAALHFSLPSSSLYAADCTSLGGVSTGDFKLYISQGETSSLHTLQANGISRLVYVPPSDRLFSLEWPYVAVTPTKFIVIDPSENVVLSSHNYTSVILLDAVYNSREGRVLLWVTSGSSGDSLEEYDISGSLINTYPISIDWGFHTRLPADLSRMCYCETHNQILLVPVATGDITPLSYSIFDCNVNEITHSELMSFTYGDGVNCTYVSSSDKYYIVSNNIADPALAVTPNYPQTSAVSAVTGSTYVLKYIPELDILIGAGNWKVTNALKIYNPATELSSSNVAGIGSMDSVLYEPCRNCIVASDDAVGNVGGLCYFDTGSTFFPLNFVLASGSFAMEYCKETSTIWIASYTDDRIMAIVSEIPTSSLPQP